MKNDVYRLCVRTPQIKFDTIPLWKDMILALLGKLLNFNNKGEFSRLLIRCRLITNLPIVLNIYYFFVFAVWP